MGVNCKTNVSLLWGAMLMMNICIHTDLYRCIYTCQGGQSQGRYKVDPGGSLGGLLQCCQCTAVLHAVHAATVLSLCFSAATETLSFSAASLAGPCWASPVAKGYIMGCIPGSSSLFTFSIFSLDYSVILGPNISFSVSILCEGQM